MVRFDLFCYNVLFAPIMNIFLCFGAKICRVFFRRKQYKANIFFVIFAPKLLSMTLQKWIEDRAIHGFPTFSVEDNRKIVSKSAETVLKNNFPLVFSRILTFSDEKWS